LLRISHCVLWYGRLSAGTWDGGEVQNLEEPKKASECASPMCSLLSACSSPERRGSESGRGWEKISWLRGLLRTWFSSCWLPC